MEKYKSNRKYLNGRRTAKMNRIKDQNYIREFLTSYEQSLLWPTTDRPTNNTAIHDNDYVLDDNIFEKIKDISRLQNCDINIIIYAVIFVVLQNYNDTDDIGFSVIDLYNSNNLLPLRIISEDFTFTDLVLEINRFYEQIATFSLEDLNIKDTSFSNLIVLLSETTTIDTLLKKNEIELYKYSKINLRISNLFITMLVLNQFNKENMLNKFVSHFKNAIESIHNNNDQLVHAIDILEADELKKLVIDYNNTNSDYSTMHTIHTLIELQTTKTPNNTAIIYNDIEYSYSTINKKSNCLANYLVERIKSKKVFIPVLMNRCLEMPISMYAIMKAGAAFIPIDCKWPHNRIIEILDDINPEIILVDSENESLVKNRYSYYKVCFDDLQENNYCFKSNVTPDDPIYAIYTSGSTGKPKGAINVHKGIVNRFLYMNQRYKCSDNDVILLTSNHVFDAAIWQIFWPLINGLKTIIPCHTKSFDIINLVNQINKYKVTITDFVPSVANLLVDLVEQRKSLVDKLQSLRHLLIGGEAMVSQHIYRLKRYLPKCEITNTYGPSETSIGTVFYKVPDEYIPEIPIGKPISNVKTLILNKRRRIVPEGCIGELYLGGDCVGDGYINDIIKTEKSFIYMQIENNISSRFYKTGDLVRYNSEGNIMYLGRNDDQLKINGIRIEIKEIETKIMMHPSVKNATVFPIVNDSNIKSLCAYIVMNDAPKTNFIEIIREFLQQNLPSAMVPAYITIVDFLPLTLNGKINKKELPMPEGMKAI